MGTILWSSQPLPQHSDNIVHPGEYLRLADFQLGKALFIGFNDRRQPIQSLLMIQCGFCERLNLGVDSI